MQLGRLIVRIGRSFLATAERKAEEGIDMSRRARRAAANNRANQMNSNNRAYWNTLSRAAGKARKLLLEVRRWITRGPM